MTFTSSTTSRDEGLESCDSGVAWAAIFGGAFAAAGITIILSPLGIAMGLGSVSPWHHTDPSSVGQAGKTLSIAGAIWLIIVQWISSGLGGYLTGRLRTKWTGAHTHEVFFRDTVHGFLAWALASVIGLMVLTISAGHMAGGGMHGMQNGARGGINSPEAYYTDSLFRIGQPSSSITDEDRREASQILAMSVLKGKAQDADLTYLAQLVASRTGVSQTEAQQRVNDTVTNQKTAMDTARKATIGASLLIALALFVGAFIACAAAALGGRDRDVHYETGKLTV